MKKTFLLFLLTLMMSVGTFRAQAEGGDYVIMLDNGFSINDQTFNEMKLGASKLAEQLLSCNPKNRVAVVHYGAGKYNAPNTSFAPRIYIENDFTNDHSVAQNITRRLYYGDHFHEALGLVGNALDGSFNANIISPQTSLTRNTNPLSPLYIITLTDANRNVGAIINGSYLVNYANPTLNTDDAFKYVIDFKIARGAKFAFVHLTTITNATTQAAQRAAAAIASQGGTYSGLIENYPSDPDAGILPRLYYNRTNGFGLYSEESHYWANIASNICNSLGWGTVKFEYEPGQCRTQAQYINGSYTLPAGATFDALKLSITDVDTGVSYPVNFNPTWIGTQFNYGLQTADFNSVPFGLGNYKFVLTLIYTYNGSTYETYSWNNYPWFDVDMNMDCPLRTAPQSLEKKAGFKLTPNPTSGAFKVILDQDITAGLLMITDVSGNTVYKKSFKDQKDIEVDIHSQNQGIYIVRVTSDKNETYSEKLIKK